MYIIEKPKVLFVGSGVLQAFGGESWDKFLDSISQRNDIDHSIDCPAPLKAIILTNDHVDKALKDKFSKSTGAEITNPDLASFLQDTLSIGFDHILTTNYTYELEAASVYPNKLSEYRIKKMQTSTAGRCEPKYLLHTYMSVPYNGKENKVWHIHGEARKPESVILGHYYYGNLLYEIKEEVKRIDNSRWKEKNNKNASWIDAFLFGDIYCLGFGFGLCEFDLWWLLNRKAREKGNNGNVYFYNPAEKDKFDSKLELLKLLRTSEDKPLVDHISLGYSEANMGNAEYKQFYLSVINDIKARI